MLRAAGIPYHYHISEEVQYHYFIGAEPFAGASKAGLPDVTLGMQTEYGVTTKTRYNSPTCMCASQKGGTAQTHPPG